MWGRLVWQSALLLLAYLDEAMTQQLLDIVEELLGHINGPATELLERTVAAVDACELMAGVTDYVETFDMRRRTIMYWTYWTAGDSAIEMAKC